MKGPRLLVWLASFAVPRSRRSDWREEWAAEIERAAEVLLPRRFGALRLLRMAAGAWLDALATRGSGGAAQAEAGRRLPFRGLANDARAALRGLVSFPGTALGIVGSLTIGIAATTAAFSLVLTVVFRPFPHVVEQSSLRYLCVDRGGSCVASYDDFLALQSSLTTFESVAARHPVDLALKLD